VSYSSCWPVGPWRGIRIPCGVDPLVKLLLLTGQRLNEFAVIITGDPAAGQQVADGPGGFRFSQGTFAGTRRNGRDSPIADWLLGVAWSSLILTAIFLRSTTDG